MEPLTIDSSKEGDSSGYALLPHKRPFFFFLLAYNLPLSGSVPSPALPVHTGFVRHSLFLLTPDSWG